MNFKRIVINRVYNKNDKKKTPAIYIYCDLDDEKKLNEGNIPHNANPQSDDKKKQD